jgi:hypothetical protein
MLLPNSIYNLTLIKNENITIIDNLMSNLTVK